MNEPGADRPDDSERLQTDRSAASRLPEPLAALRAWSFGADPPGFQAVRMAARCTALSARESSLAVGSWRSWNSSPPSVATLKLGARDTGGRERRSESSSADHSPPTRRRLVALPKTSPTWLAAVHQAGAGLAPRGGVLSQASASDSVAIKQWQAWSVRRRCVRGLPFGSRSPAAIVRSSRHHNAKAPPPVAGGRHEAGS